jgi:hypothetical protein
MAGYPIVIVFRLFNTFDAQARLAVVTKTLNKSSMDLFHFLIVFSTIFLIYVISAVSLFGHTVDDLATISRSITTTGLAVLGDFDWDVIKEQGRIEAGVWFWTFMGLVSLVLMNMLIAIVMDAYSEVKDGAKDSKTMWQEVAMLGRRMIGEHPVLRLTIGGILSKLRIATIPPLVPLQEISTVIKSKAFALRKLKRAHQARYNEWLEESMHNKDDEDSPEPVDPSKVPEQYEVQNLKVYGLCDMVHSLSYEQASELLLEMVQRYYSTHQRAASYEDARLFLQALLHDLKALKHSAVEKISSPSSQVPEKSFRIRCAVDALKEQLKGQQLDPHAEHREKAHKAPHNIPETIDRLELELDSVRKHVDDELAEVSRLHWQVSELRRERMSLESACQLLQEKATELAASNTELRAQLPTNGAAYKGDDTAAAMNLMQHLASETHKIQTELSARRLDLEVRAPAENGMNGRKALENGINGHGMNGRKALENGMNGHGMNGRTALAYSLQVGSLIGTQVGKHSRYVSV